MSSYLPLIRIVDFAGNHGGGLRFSVEVMRAMIARQEGRIRFELLSYGDALTRYRKVLEAEGLDIPTREFVPTTHRRKWLVRLRSLPKLSGILSRVGVGSNIVHGLPAGIDEGCDLIWLPWIHFHLAPRRLSCPLVASLHDLIIFQYPGLMPWALVNSERRNLYRWFSLPTRIVVSSKATQKTITSLFGVANERCDTARVSGEHENPVSSAQIDPAWTFLQRPFLLCPANFSRHKNHECLFRALALCGKKIPVVLTGKGTDLNEPARRTGELRREIARCGLTVGRDIFTLGYLDDAFYFGLLAHAWALVMPSFHEGGGSFPTMEAMMRGVPVLCSDIPVLREQMAEMKGEVLWFDPHSPSALARCLEQMDQNYSEIKLTAMNQIAGFRRRTWRDVARDYERIFSKASPLLKSALETNVACD